MKEGVRWAKIYLVFFVCAAVFLVCGTCQAAEEKQKKEKVPDIGEVRIIRASDIEQKEWTMEGYTIDTGDILEISVWQVEELHKEVIVRPDGRISYPLIGDVLAAGLTVDEIVAQITEKLKTYIKNPQVSAIVRSFGGKKVVILGEISDPGLIRFTEPIRVMEALALSGGYNEAASIKNVLIIRGDLNNYTEVIVVNVVDILKGNLRENIYLQKNDIIYLPRSFVGNVAYFIRQISPLLGAAQTFYNIKKEYWLIKRHVYKKTPTATEDVETANDGILKNDQ